MEYWRTLPLVVNFSRNSASQRAQETTMISVDGQSAQQATETAEREKAEGCQPGIDARLRTEPPLLKCQIHHTQNG